MSDHPTIGASQIAAIMGLNPFQTEHDVWNLMVHGVKQPDNDSMQEGREWEPDIIRIYERRSGRATAPNQITVKRNWLHATPDGLVAAKTPPGLMGLMDAKKSNDSPWPVLPEYYHLQGQAQLYCWGDHESSDFAALFPRFHFQIYPVLPDLDLQEKLNAFAEKWIKDYVLPKKMPPITSSEACRKAIIAQWPEAESEALIDEDEEILERLARVRGAQLEKKSYEEIENEEKNWLRQRIKDAAGISSSFANVSFLRNKSTQKQDHEAVIRRLSMALIEAKGESMATWIQDMIEEETKEVPGPRVLRITWKDTSP